jgi:hypothetical protein
MMLLPALSEANDLFLFSAPIFGHGSALEKGATYKSVFYLRDGSLHGNPDLLALMGLTEFT